MARTKPVYKIFCVSCKRYFNGFTFDGSVFENFTGKCRTCSYPAVKCGNCDKPFRGDTEYCGECESLRTECVKAEENDIE